MRLIFKKELEVWQMGVTFKAGTSARYEHMENGNILVKHAFGSYGLSEREFDIYCYPLCEQCVNFEKPSCTGYAEREIMLCDYQCDCFQDEWTKELCDIMCGEK